MICWLRDPWSQACEKFFRTKTMKITYRQGKKADSPRIAQLDNIASDGAIEFLFHGLIPNVSPEQIVASNIENDNYHRD